MSGNILLTNKTTDLPDANETEMDQNIDFLTASELVSLRKPDEELERCVIGEKFYTQSETWLEKKAVECALESHKDSLEKKRAARVCDLMQAEWNEELKVSLTSKLKGKFVHHMGHAHNGKIALSPEESLFLLENGYIEIMNGTMPLSTEEAYNVMLKDNLSAEKYQVYSHLSQLGFIVVSHQAELGVTRYEKSINLDKQPTKKKRKMMSSLCEEPEKKRLTFTGAFSKEKEPEIFPGNTESQSNLSTELVEQKNSSESVEQNFTKESPFASINNEQIEKPKESKTTDSISDITINEHHEEVKEHLVNNAVSTTTNTQIADKDSVKSIITTASASYEGEELAKQIREDVKENKDSSNLDNTNLNNITENSTQVNAQHSTVDFASTNQIDMQQDVEDSLPCNETNSSLLSQNGELQTPANVSHSKTDVDVMDVDSENTEVSVDTSRDSFGVNNVSNLNGNHFYDSSCTVINNAESAVNILTEGNSNSDVMSCSSESDENDDVISLHAASENSHLNDSFEDNEVELLEITKKETKPLDVIDIASEESSGSEISIGEEEIQVVRVCSGLTPKVPTISRPNNIRKLDSFKKEERGSPITNPKFLSPSLMVQFPDLFRKDVVCVARPPLNLLPNNVKPSKEAYVLDLKSKSDQQSSQPRLWNSFRDMQDYQRARRHNSNSSQPFPSFWNREQGPRMDFRQNFNQRVSTPAEMPQNYQNRDPGPWSDRGYRDHRSNLNYRPTDSPEVLANSHKSYSLSSDQSYSSGPSGGLLPDPSRFPIPGAATMNSVVSVSNQDMNVSMVGNHQFNTPLNLNNGLASSFSPNLSMLSGLGPADIIAEVQRTAYSVATNMLSSMFGHTLPLPNPPPMQQFPAFQQGRNLPPFNFTPRYNAPFNTQNYNTEHYTTYNRRGYREQYRRQHRGAPFPCHYRGLGNRHSWSEVKEAVGDKDKDSPVGSDVEEIPINTDEFLWDPKGICPLVKPGTKYPSADVFKTLQVTRMANLLEKSMMNEKCFPTTCSLEISFDVYLPGTNYRKTCPDIPKHRVVVIRSTDPVPRYSEIAFLQRKWNDGAALRVAVVDNGDISFISFNSIYLPVMTPHEN